jgi:hypothetical protein
VFIPAIKVIDEALPNIIRAPFTFMIVIGGPADSFIDTLHGRAFEVRDTGGSVRLIGDVLVLMGRAWGICSGHYLVFCVLEAGL